MEKAIQKSIEGGWDPYTMKSFDGLETLEHSEVLLDPLFWQCLGKAEGWKKRRPYMSVMGVRDYYKNPEMTRSELSATIIDEWEVNWHRLITHLAEGKNPEEFFKELLTKK